MMDVLDEDQFASLIDALSIFQTKGKRDRRQQAIAQLLGLAEQEVNRNSPLPFDIMLRGPSNEPFLGVGYRREF